MKSLSTFLVIFSLIVLVHSYTVLYPAPKKVDPAHPNECFDEEVGIYYKQTAEVQQRPAKCEAVTCNSDLSMSIMGWEYDFFKL